MESVKKFFCHFFFQSFTEAQRAHISSNTMKVLYNVKDEITDIIKQESGGPNEPAPPGV